MTLNDFFIGWDSHFSDLLSKANDVFPHQSIAILNDGSYIIELALAGYSKNDVQVSVEGDLLIIGSDGAKTSTDDGRVYKQKGIAKRKFKKTYLLNKNHEVKSANMEDGLLSIVVSPIAKVDTGVKLINVQ